MYELQGLHDQELLPDNLSHKRVLSGDETTVNVAPEG